MIAIPQTADISTSRNARSDNDAAENSLIAEQLLQISRLLQEQGASEFRVHAYEHAAQKLIELPRPVRVDFEAGGIDALVRIPTIGVSIAHLIQQYLETRRIALLDRLRGDHTAEHLFATIPSVGPKLSHLIHEQLQLETLSELYQAACDGRLNNLRGIGRKRVAAIRDCLARRLRSETRSTTQHKSMPQQGNPSVPIAELLDIDAEYHRLVAEGKLRKIAPRRFNPGAVAWLPILHTHRGDRHYTVMYSNTARAHDLGMTKDWVLIYRDDHDSHGHWTVITSYFGKLKGCRIIPGREDECMSHYRETAQHALYSEPSVSDHRSSES